MNPNQNVEHLFRRLVEQLIHETDSLRVEWQSNGSISTVKVSVAASDMRLLIGRQGVTYRALAQLIAEIGKKDGRTIKLLRLDEPWPGVNRSGRSYRPDPSWNRKEILGLIGELSESVFEFPVKVESRDQDGGTLVMVEVSREEFFGRIATVRSAFATIFTGIGRRNGCELLVGVGQSAEPIAKR